MCLQTASCCGDQQKTKQVSSSKTFPWFAFWVRLKMNCSPMAILLDIETFVIFRDLGYPTSGRLKKQSNLCCAGQRGRRVVPQVLQCRAVTWLEILIWGKNISWHIPFWVQKMGEISQNWHLNGEWWRIPWNWCPNISHRAHEIMRRNWGRRIGNVKI